jgi:hypothetical protein
VPKAVRSTTGDDARDAGDDRPRDGSAGELRAMPPRALGVAPGARLGGIPAPIRKLIEAALRIGCGAARSGVELAVPQAAS